MANYEQNALRNAIYLVDLVTKTDATSDANAIANDALNAEVNDALDAKIEVNDSKITIAIL